MEMEEMEQQEPVEIQPGVQVVASEVVQVIL
jgi:hypothetical protein